MHDRPKPFTPEEVAKRWDCSAAAIRTRIHKGELPAFRLGKLLRVPADAIAALEGISLEALQASRAAGAETTRPVEPSGIVQVLAGPPDAFRKAELTQACEAIMAAGLKIERIEIQPEGTVVVFPVWPNDLPRSK